MFPIALLALLFACTKPSNVILADYSSAKNESGEVILLLGQTREIDPSANDGFHVQFSKLIQDSRCPTSVVCVQKGTAIIELAFTANDRKIIEIEKSIIHTSNGTNYRVTFLKLNPYPANGGALDIHVLEARLLIEKI